MSASVAAAQRFTRNHPCPICGGNAQLRQGRGERCFGFLSSDGTYAHCSRTEYAGALLIEEDAQTYAHRLGGGCKCGDTHAQCVSFQRPPVRKESSNGRPESNPLRRKISESRWLITHDPQGQPVEHVRFDFDDGTKQIWWQRGPTTNLEGLNPKTFPFYGKRREGALDVIIVEGEKACDALEGVMLPRHHTDVLGTVLGAPRLPHDEVLEELARYDTVYLWPDNDAKGRQLMQRLGERLIALGRKAETIQMIDWVSGHGNAGADAADFVAGGGTADELLSPETPDFLFAVFEERAGAFADAEPEKSDRKTANTGHETENSLHAPHGHKQNRRYTRLLTFRGSDEIAAHSGSAPQMIAPYLFRGSLTELDGAIKTSGKTTFVTHLCRAILEGLPFLGTPTIQSPIVYLTEQPPASFGEALRRADLLNRPDFRYLHFGESIGVPWAETVRQARDEAERVGASVLIVDTLSQWAGLTGDDENSAGAAMQAMAPLQAAATEDKLAVKTLRHDNKRGGGVGQSARGSSAFGGAVDVIARIRRPDQQDRPSIRIVEAISRFDGVPDVITVDLTSDGYELVGGDEAAGGQEARFALAKHMPRTPLEAMTEVELIAASGVGRSSMRRALDEYREYGFLRETGGGVRGAPKRYWFPRLADEPVSLSDHRVRGQETTESPSSRSERDDTRSETDKPASLHEFSSSRRADSPSALLSHARSEPWSETTIPANCDTKDRCVKSGGCLHFQRTGTCLKAGAVDDVDDLPPEERIHRRL